MRGQIYAEAALTIVVVAGLDPEHGIPGVGTSMRSADCSVEVEHHCLTCVRLTEHEIEQSKWNTRGW